LQNKRYVFSLFLSFSSFFTSLFLLHDLGFSNRNLVDLCRAAQSHSTAHLIDPNNLESVVDISVDQLRPVSLRDFDSALELVQAKTSETELKAYQEWKPGGTE
jgi:hypothetical protein